MDDAHNALPLALCSSLLSALLLVVCSADEEDSEVERWAQGEDFTSREGQCGGPRHGQVSVAGMCGGDGELHMREYILYCILRVRRCRFVTSA